MKSTIKGNEKQDSCQYNRDLSGSECMVSGALALVLRFTRCAGVAPLRIRATRAGWLVAFSPSLTVLQRILMTVLNMVALAALILDIQEDPDRRIRVGPTAIGAIVWIFDLVLVMVITSLAAYWGSTRMENLIRIMKQLQQINIDLNKDPCKRTETIGVVAAASMLIFMLAVSIAELYLQINNNMHQGFNWSIMAMYSVYYVAGISGLVALMQWGYTAAEVHAAATALNHHLQRLLHGPNLIADTQWVQSMIHRLALSHEHISDVIKQMHAGNGAFIMAILLSTFMRLVATPYYLALWLNSDDKDLSFAVLHVSFGILHIATLFLTIEPCHWTQAERETTKYLLSRLMVRLAPRNALLSSELEQLVKQTMLTDVKFAPLGLGTLGRPYMSAILGGVLSYLVILLQFQMFAPSSNNRTESLSTATNSKHSL